MIIKPACPHCGRVITIDVKSIDKLQREVDALKLELQQIRQVSALNDIFKGFK